VARLTWDEARDRYGPPRDTPGERIAEGVAWVLGLGGLLAWVVTGRWPLAVAGVAITVGTLFLTTLRQERREAAAEAAEADPATDEERRAALLADAEAEIQPWSEKAEEWLAGAPERDIPGERLGDVVVDGETHELASRSSVAFCLGSGFVFTEAPRYTFTGDAFPADYADSLRRTYPRPSTGSVYRTPAGDVALRWVDEDPPEAPGPAG
jgi:hypothetical protein